ncbi:hypothetical protein BKA67DRAFT_11318 [Truncatella angustata]|uniref:Zn(2)-C6 fungal-type domain-containing protein n=1 Tax=Truncatella angustata TaxID=152316 RepID=A0A9P8UW82_9PEZI|nr:uncharacterized protein BKA67DRAFT_11318 [Truncatella angustata]KAH6659347.1 hypothetical protein BKA67DRAFT_11318 [Truncatella angustata]
MNYTRKRALLACDFCRHRKRRCDGKKPCSTCRDSDADCVYKELPYDRIEDASPAAVADRLSRIEALLEQQSQQLRQLSTSSTPTNVSVIPFDFTQSPLLPQATEFNEFPVFPQDNIESPTFLIPKGHTALTTTLLSVPHIQEEVGGYARDFFYKIEETQPLPASLGAASDDRQTWPPLRQNMLNKLSDSYFQNVHPHQPLFSASTFELLQSKLLKNERMADTEAAICLCVYALGAITTSAASIPGASSQVLGLGFFKPALAIILYEYTWNFKSDLSVCQALLLAGSYFSHLGRPLQSWRMVFFASQRLLQNMELRHGETPFSGYNEEELRAFWQCFLEDCNRAEDLDVLRSGIEPLGDKMPLPHSLDPSDHEETIHLFAEIAIRRLLNRVHSSLYSPDTENTATGGFAETALLGTSLSLQKLLTLSSELDRQLEQWYTSIPDGIRPPRGVEIIPTDRGRILRIRYYAARQLIHRPFILYSVAQYQHYRGSTDSISPGTSGAGVPSLLPPVVIEKCELCIESCAKYIYNTIEMLDKRSPYLWSLTQGCLACLTVLRLAESFAPLREFVPPMRPLKETVIAKTRKWAVEGSSFEAVVAILEAMEFREAREAGSVQ